MTLRTRRPCLELLEGRDAPAVLAVSYSPVTHTLTVVGTDADNDLTITGDSADATHFLLSSTTDTFAGGGTTYASPSGVQNISVRMLAGNDTVTVSNGLPVQLAGGLSIDGGDGYNRVTAADLTVGKSLAIRNGTNTAGADITRLTNLNVNGSLTIANGDGDTDTRVTRSFAGVSTVRGGVGITNGTGTDTNVLNDLNVGGNLTVRNGRTGGGVGFTQVYNDYNTSSPSQVRGSVSVSYLDGNMGQDEFYDAEVGGSVAVSYGTGRGAIDFDAYRTGVPVRVHGSLSVTGTGPKFARSASRRGLGVVIDKNLTVTGGAAADTVTLTKATVNGTTTLSLGDGDNTVSIDDSLFVGPFRLTAGGGTDTINLETATGTGTGTTFVRAVTMALGAGVDSLTLGGSNDANQALVFAGSFVVHHGADGESPTTFGKDVYPFGGGLQWVV